MTSRAGRVYLVGAGPGDPGLLTLRAGEVLETAEVLLYDALAGDAIVSLAPASCERIYVGKRAGEHALAQHEIERLMVAKAREGRQVVRLKGGDPFVFGRGGEEAQALHAAGIAFEVVPGVSSAYAVPAYAGIPVTHRDHAAAFTVATAHEDPAKPASSLDWAKLADSNRTLVFLMATANLREVAAQLIAHGLAPQTPVAVVQDGTRPTQRVVTGTLENIGGAAAVAGIGPPAIVVVGSVAALRCELAWFDKNPLFGKRVLVTRAGAQSKAFALALLRRGAEPIVAPTIEIRPSTDASAAERAIDRLASYAWIVFTSQNGVDAFFSRLRDRGADARALGGVKVAAIGERTARRLRGYGVCADLVPPDYISEAVARAVIAVSQSGERILLYRAAAGRDVLPHLLEAAGLAVTDVAGYATAVPPDPAFAQKVARADVLTFTSASTVRGFATLLHPQTPASAAAGKCIACIGPVTSEAAGEAGLHVDVNPSTYTTAGLLAALDAHCGTPQ